MYLGESIHRCNPTEKSVIIESSSERGRIRSLLAEGGWSGVVAFLGGGGRHGALTVGHCEVFLLLLIHFVPVSVRFSGVG